MGEFPVFAQSVTNGRHYSLRFSKDYRKGCFKSKMGVGQRLKNVGILGPLFVEDGPQSKLDSRSGTMRVETNNGDHRFVIKFARNEIYEFGYYGEFKDNNDTEEGAPVPEIKCLQPAGSLPPITTKSGYR